MVSSSFRKDILVLENMMIRFLGHKPLAVFVCVVCCAGAVHAARRDNYSEGFYTRGASTAEYLDQGAVYDPFYVEAAKWAVVPRVTLGAFYEDNYYLDEEDGESLFEVDWAPGLMLLYGRPGRNRVFVDAGVVLPLYSSLSNSEDRVSTLFRVGGDYNTGRSLLNGSFGYRRLDEVNTVAGERLVASTYIGALGGEYRVSGKSSVGASGVVEFHEYDSDGYIDYRRDYVALRGIYTMTPISDMYVQGGVGRDILDLQSLGQYGDADFFDVSLGVRGKLTSKTALSGSIGYRQRSYDDPDIDEVSGVVGSIAGETTPFGLSTFSVEYASDIRPDITGTGHATADQRVSGGVNRRLFTERLRGGAHIHYGNVEYYGEGDDPAEDMYWGYGFALDWWLRGDFSMGVQYAYSERDSGARSVYESNRVTAHLGWNY